METRSIQKTGGSSFSLTLPKSWVVKNGLEDTGIVEIYDNNTNQLIIQPQKLNNVYSANLVIDHLPDSHIIRELIGIYISGADEIAITAKTISYKQRSLIRSISHKLIGFELVEESSERIFIKNVANSTIDITEYLKQMIGIIQSMFSDIIKTINTSDCNLALDIIERDIEVDRIHLAILRQFNIVLTNAGSNNLINLTTADLHFYELAGIRLERIADHIVRIALMISVLKNKDKIVLNKNEYSDLIQIQEYINNFPDIILNLDKQLSHKFLDKYESKIKNEFIKQSTIKKSSTNILIQDSIERISSYIANIAEETINHINTKNLSSK